MGRWEPNARGRLEEAAMALFRERGYDRTTVQEIADRAGLTERTFFRYFADKREVLFGGSDALKQHMADAMAGVPASAAPLDVVAAALESVAEVLEPRRVHAHARRALVATHAELREREVMKLAALSAALAAALAERGVPQHAAVLAAEAGIAVFKVAFERWLDDPQKRGMVHHIHASLDELAAVTSRRARPAKARPKRQPR
jgi:AcrR family transcriptional regulator